MSRKLTEQAIDWAYEKWLDGYNKQEIAKALGIPYYRLLAEMDARGLERVLPPLQKPDFPVWEEEGR